MAKGNMIVARSLGEVAYERNSVVTVGTFDGVHCGHEAIIREVTARSKTRGARSVVVTFDPHPKEIVGSGPVAFLASLEERLSKFRELGIDLAFVVAFTFDFSRLTSREFFERYIVRGVGVSDVIVGHDHMFGRNREAGFRELQKMGGESGFSASVLEPVTVDGDIVSSSSIRRMLSEGDVSRAARFLGREYGVRGLVVHGEGRGKELGVPTANIEPDFAKKLIPSGGVYVVRVIRAGSEQFGMLNIGQRPTFGPDGRRTLEVNIFAFDGELYGESVEVRFLKRLRDERKFSSVDDLRRQLQIDRSESLAYIAAQSTAQASS